MSLEDVAVVQTGVSKSDSRAILDAIEVPYLRVANVQDGYVELGDLKTIRLERTQLQRYVLREGDVLLTEGGDADKLGRGCVWAGQAAPCVHQNHVFVVRTAPGNLLPEFLSRQTGTTYGRAYFKACSKQTTNLASINSSQVKQYPVLLPPIGEQRQIVEALSAWDHAIQSAEQLLTLKERRKRALMGQLLTGKKRFREFYQSKALGMEWPFKHVREIFERVSRKNGDTTDLVLTASGRHGLVDQRGYFDRKVSGDSLEKYYLLKRGEFAYNRSAMSGYPFGAIKRLDAHPCGAVSTLYHCFALKNRESDSDFFKHLFEAGLLNHQLRRICQVGGRAHGLLNVTAGDFENMAVPVPSKEEQMRIATVLNGCENEIGQLYDQLEALRAQKKGLMNQLLTGLIRVPQYEG